MRYCRIKKCVNYTQFWIRYIEFKKMIKITLHVLFYLPCLVSISFAQKRDVTFEARQTMLNATKFIVENVSTNGGYVSHYFCDLSRRWGELEAYRTQIWIGGNIPFTQNMGELFLNAYDVTSDEYYYQAADKVARALIWGQLSSGGWDHIIDFAGEPSLKQWYNTIGKNAWGWDEYNHYYGTGTFKTNSITAAGRFLLRLYLKKLDPVFKPSLDKAIDFFIESQSPLGGWPQRYPSKHRYQYGDKEDYTSFYTLNDDVTWQNIEFLIQCYTTLGDERLLDPIRRGMDFSLVSQQGNPQGGWAEAYDMSLNPVHGRQYEPAALTPGQTLRQISLLMLFYEFTGDRKFLARIPDAFQWLESARLPQSMKESGKYTHPIFVEVGTNKPLFAHRKGNGITSGRYYVDYNDDNPLMHYGSKVNYDESIKSLRQQYERMKTLSLEDVVKKSPLKNNYLNEGRLPQSYFEHNHGIEDEISDDLKIREIIDSLDDQHRWLTRNEWISPPYFKSATEEESNTAPLSTEEGLQIRENTDQEYISTKEYIKNMNLLINYLKIMDY